MAFVIRSARVPGVHPRQFQTEGRTFYYITIALEAERGDSLDDVRMVVYELDPSFGDRRYVVSVDRDHGFQVAIWTYGFFEATATVIRKDNRVVQVRGEVEWEMSYSSSSSSSSSGGF